MKPKILRITTVPISLNILLKGQLKYVTDAGYQVTTASAAGVEVDEIKRREGVTHHIIPFTRVFSPLKDLKALLELIKLIKRERPDIVHSHTPKAGLLGMLAAKYCNVPVRLHTVAGMPLMEASGIAKLILKQTERLTYWAANDIYPNSFQLKEYMENHFSTFSRKFKVLASGSSNGIDTEFFKVDTISTQIQKQLRDQLNIRPDDFVFVFVGRLVKDKGIHELIHAFLQLNGKLKLLLVGSYEDERNPVDADVKKAIEENENIIPVGFQKDIRPYLAISNAFVFPSYREGFPNVVLQAASMELPCIVSDINGCNEIIKHEYNGLIVPSKNDKAVKEAMDSLSKNSKFWKNLKEHSREAVESNYKQEVVWKALLNEYESKLKKLNT